MFVMEFRLCYYGWFALALVACAFAGVLSGLVLAQTVEVMGWGDLRAGLGQNERIIAVVFKGERVRVLHQDDTWA